MPGPPASASSTANYTGRVTTTALFRRNRIGVEPGMRGMLEKCFILTFNGYEEKGRKREAQKSRGRSCKVQRNRRDYRPSKGGLGGGGRRNDGLGGGRRSGKKGREKERKIVREDAGIMGIPVYRDL